MGFHLPKAALAARRQERPAERRASQLRFFHCPSPRGRPHRWPLARGATMSVPSLSWQHWIRGLSTPDGIVLASYSWLKDALPQCQEQAGASTGTEVRPLKYVSHLVLVNTFWAESGFLRACPVLGLGGGKQDQQGGHGRSGGPGAGRLALAQVEVRDPHHNGGGPVGPWGGVGPQETQGWAAPAFLSLANFPHVLWPPPALPHSPPFLLGPPLGSQLPRELSHSFCHSTDTLGVLAGSSGRAGRAWASSQCPAEWAWYI